MQEHRFGTAVGELDDFLAELQAEKLPRVAGGGSAAKPPSTIARKDPALERTPQSGIDLLMGDQEAIAPRTSR